MQIHADDVPSYEVAARLELLRAQRIAALWQRPVLADDEIPVALGLAVSSWYALKAKGQGPRTFSIGRRVFARTEDLRAWLDERAAKAAPQSEAA